jgi:hypothetical protein
MKRILIILASCAYVMGSIESQYEKARDKARAYVEDVKAYVRAGTFTLPTSFSLTVKGGVAPTLFADSGDLLIALSDATPVLYRGAKGQDFNDIWHNPTWNIAFDLAYSPVDTIEFFGEFNYHRATARADNIFTVNSSAGRFGTFQPNAEAFQTYGGYIGSRLFTTRKWNNKIAFFIGSKVGVITYSKIDAQPLTIISNNVTVSQNTPWFESRSVVSGGVQTGFDFLMSNALSLFFNAEVVASGSMKPKFNIVKQNTTLLESFTNIVREAPGTVVSFPVNLGLRYYFDL